MSIEALLAAAKTDRPNHAYLLLGPLDEARALAKRLAMTLECEAAAEERPCGACAACLRVGNETHPDVHLLLPERDALKLEQVRDWRRDTRYYHYQGRWQVFLLERAGTMTEQSANSMLKLLEEPPAGTVFVLYDETADRLLPTVLSRCQIYRLVGETVPEADLEGAAALLNELPELQRADLLLRTAELDKDRLRRLLLGMQLLCRDLTAAAWAPELPGLSTIPLPGLPPRAALALLPEIEQGLELLQRNIINRLLCDTLLLRFRRIVTAQD